MKRDLILTTKRAVEVYKAMIWRRRLYRADQSYFKAIDYWDWQYGADTIKAYKSADEEIGRPGVISFGGRVCLTADDRRIMLARSGHAFSNTLVGHEISHVALGHHKQFAQVTNFDLGEGSYGKVIVPKNLREKEADFGSTVFLCGVALKDKKMSALELARRACADVAQVEKAQRLIQLDVFQRELWLPKPDIVFHNL